MDQQLCFGSTQKICLQNAKKNYPEWFEHMRQNAKLSSCDYIKTVDDDLLIFHRVWDREEKKAIFMKRYYFSK
jgi:hypothetical protein